MQVFDAARRVQGVTGSIEILRTGTTGNLLHVSDLYDIRNESSPPLTQAVDRPFGGDAPAKTHINFFRAPGPGEVRVMISSGTAPDVHATYTVIMLFAPH